MKVKWVMTSPGAWGAFAARTACHRQCPGKTVPFGDHLSPVCMGGLLHLHNTKGHHATHVPAKTFELSARATGYLKPALIQLVPY